MTSEEEIEKIKEELKQLKKQNRILAEALLTHIKGKLTIEDLEICYNALSKVKKYTSIVGGYGGGGIEAIVAQELARSRSGGHKERDEPIFEKADEQEVEDILKELKKEDKKEEKDNDREDKKA